MAGLRSIPASARGLLDGWLLSHAQLLFSRSRLVGSLLVLATLTDPQALAFGLLGFAAAAVVAALLRVDGVGIGATPYGPNALLVALGVGHLLGASPLSLGLLVVASGGSVLVTAALQSLLGGALAVPVFAVPFVLVTWLTKAAADAHSLVPNEPLGIPAPTFDIAPVDAALRSAGALLFAPQVVAGGLVLLALVLHSRIASLLALLGALAAAPFALPASGPTAVLNGALASVALGGVFFVPSASSFVVGGVGAALAGLITAAIAEPLSRASLTPLILPFAASVGIVLLAMRQRVGDGRPKSVDFASGSPEQNLAYYQLRLSRFRYLYAVQFQLPFRGAWVCTQGVDGEITHKAEWRHAFDFEVSVPGGALFQGAGTSLEDHYCYRLPVLAAADGVVVKVENHIPDNAVGGLDLARNWGNVVVIEHAPGLYSLVAHLAPGSVRVAEGARVRRGDPIGACGNSGRSPRPHLHFQLQATAAVGAPTLPCRFTDVVLCHDDGEELSSAALPEVGQTVRNIESDETTRALFEMAPGTVLEVQSGGAVEHLESDVDLLGGRILRSRERGAVLYFVADERGFTAYEVVGDPSSALHLLRAALARVPFDQGRSRWSDYLPRRWGASPWLLPLRDFIAPFAPYAGVLVDYRLERGPLGVVVTGVSRKSRGANPAVRTRAELSAERGLERVVVEVGNRLFRVVRRDGVASVPTTVLSDRRPMNDAPVSPRASTVRRAVAESVRAGEMS